MKARGRTRGGRRESERLRKQVLGGEDDLYMFPGLKYKNLQMDEVGKDGWGR